MFFHILKHRLKMITRNRVILFWTLLFPIVLGTLFYMAFSNLSSSEQLQPIKLIIVGEIQDTYLNETLKTVSEGEDRLFDLETVEQEEIAKEKLEKEEAELYLKDGILTITSEGLSETITKEFLDLYHQKRGIIEDMILLNHGKVTPEMFEEILQTKDFLQRTSYSKEKPDMAINYFFTLIAMACLSSGFWGVQNIQDIQANQSKRAARINLAPVQKLKVLLANFTASMIISFILNLLLLAYLMFVLKLDFGNQIGAIVLTCLLGDMVGISLGMFITSIFKSSEILQSSIFLAVTMIGSFLSGMMVIDMKYWIQKYVPIVGYLNPSNLLTDAFYSLYYYDTYERFITNISLLGAFTVILILGTFLMTRRQKYDYI